MDGQTDRQTVTDNFTLTPTGMVSSPRMNSIPNSSFPWTQTPVSLLILLTHLMIYLVFAPDNNPIRSLEISNFQ